jgi:membrane protease YdiL (CAAX protease family)
MKLMQGITAIGTFVIPSLLAAFLFSSRPASFMKLDRMPSRFEMFAVMGLVLVTAPLINWMLEWNQHLVLPEFLKGVEAWMKESEDKAAGLIEAFMKMPEWTDLAMNLFIIGLLPAIGEEFLFRGLIQQLLKGFIRNTFLAILFTSILFSAIHLQFYGFFPRMMLGMLLGYLLEWSGSLWLPVLLHFLNNSIPVIITWYDPQIDLDSMGIGPGDNWQVIVSLVLTGGLLYAFYSFSVRRNRIEEASVNTGSEDPV